MGNNKTEELRAIIMAHEAQRGSPGRVDMKVVCPYCMIENPASRLTCWHCGENIVEAKQFQEKLDPPTVVLSPSDYPTLSQSSVAFPNETPTTDDLVSTQAILALGRDHSKPEKPSSLIQVAFSVGISLLIILLASIIFQVLKPAPRMIFIAGIIIGFGILMIKTSSVSKDSNEGANSSESVFPEWFTLPIVLAFGIIGLAFAFGWDFMIEWLFSQDPGERILALIFGAVFGIVIEYSLNYTLQTIKRYRLV